MFFMDLFRSLMITACSCSQLCIDGPLFHRLATIGALAMASPPESPEDEELALFLQRNALADVVEVVEENEKKEVEEEKEVVGKEEEVVGKEIEEGEKDVKEEAKLDVKLEVKEEVEDEWQDWQDWWAEADDGQEEIDERSKDEIPSPKTPVEADEDQVWKSMGLNKPPQPPQRRTRGHRATKRHNSNQRQNERNLAKKLMNQRHGASRWNASWWASSSSSWRGWSSSSWHSWPEQSWRWSGDQDGWGGSSGSTTRLLEKALDKIPDAR